MDSWWRQGGQTARRQDSNCSPFPRVTHWRTESRSRMIAGATLHGPGDLQARGSKGQRLNCGWLVATARWRRQPVWSHRRVLLVMEGNVGQGMWMGIDGWYWKWATAGHLPHPGHGDMNIGGCMRAHAHAVEVICCRTATGARRVLIIAVPELTILRTT